MLVLMHRLYSIPFHRNYTNNVTRHVSRSNTVTHKKHIRNAIHADFWPIVSRFGHSTLKTYLVYPRLSPSWDWFSHSLHKITERACILDFCFKSQIKIAWKRMTSVQLFPFRLSTNFCSDFFYLPPPSTCLHGVLNVESFNCW